MQTILGLFNNRPDAEAAITKFEDYGLEPKDILIIMKDTKEAENISKSAGIPKNQAKLYEDRLRENAILLAIPVSSRFANNVWDIFDDCNATDVTSFRSEKNEYRTQNEYIPTFVNTGLKGGKTKRRKR